eukprot:TRINITY_DN82023_c0_g1_i1.p1 TRINITY_DN82023_c0_g1~~TRINITY_DN82023_c0_g1_i1.p1  ORF type:complete len:380 (-),score=69.90 TRINITY_DN82023_c0_g1_i1:12-1151(-)
MVRRSALAKICLAALALASLRLDGRFLRPRSTFCAAGGAGGASLLPTQARSDALTSSTARLICSPVALRAEAEGKESSPAPVAAEEEATPPAPAPPRRRLTNEDYREPGSWANIGSFQIRRPLAAIPFLLLGLLADLGGSMRFLLSLNPELARRYRLDATWGVGKQGENPMACSTQPAACLKRFYASNTYSCTFSYPATWAQDPSVDFARQQAEEQMLSMRRPNAASTALPLVAVRPVQNAISVSLYARRTSEASLREAVGTPEKALELLLGRFTKEAPKLKGVPPISDIVGASEVFVEGSGPSYRLEAQVRYPGDTDANALLVYTNALFAPAPGGAKTEGGHVMLLTGVCPLKGSAELVQTMKDISSSLALLPAELAS